jgi:hypothetical protein
MARMSRFRAVLAAAGASVACSLALADASLLEATSWGRISQAEKVFLEQLKPMKPKVRHRSNEKVVESVIEVSSRERYEVRISVPAEPCTLGPWQDLSNKADSGYDVRWTRCFGATEGWVAVVARDRKVPAIVQGFEASFRTALDDIVSPTPRFDASCP